MVCELNPCKDAFKKCNPNQTPSRLFCRNKQANFKFIWKSKRPKRARIILEKRTKLKDL